MCRCHEVEKGADLCQANSEFDARGFTRARPCARAYRALQMTTATTTDTMIVMTHHESPSAWR